MSYLDKAISDGHAEFSGTGKQERIIYKAVNWTERYSDPEEKVRAEFWAELIYRYGYPPQRIGVEIVVPDRTPSDRADLVVFEDDSRTRPFAVIECKRDGITDAEFNQAVEQACGNGTWAKFRAKYVMVVAGATRRAFDFTGTYGVLEREKNIIADLPRSYGKPEDFKYHKGGSLDIKGVDKWTLMLALHKCHQTLWGGGKRNPPAAFGELCKIIFVKISDEKLPRKMGAPYQFQVKTHEPPHRLAERIRALYDQQKMKDPEVFTENIKIDDAEMLQVVSHLEGINLNATELDTKGVAFEQFIGDFFKGDAGQYFTPREIVEFTVEMLQPASEDYVLDPACGSGGFLLYALDAVRREAEEFYPDDPVRRYAHWHDFAEKRLFGIEINEEIARVTKMNMIVHDDGHTNIIGTDGLERFTNLQKINSGFKENRFDVILTNPPFGAQYEQTRHHHLSEFELGNQRDAKGKAKPRRMQKTDILYIERVWQFLKPEGRAAIVLPDGTLTNSSLQYVRDYLLQRFQLLAVVSLPQSAFAHYGAGVKSSLIFLRKRRKDETPRDDEAIFMAAPEKIGYDATGRKCENELPQVIEQYRAFKKDPTPFFV
jgi:type I restriction enzyme M protein